MSGHACTKLATFLFTPCFKAFSLVIFLAMLSRLRPNAMRKSPFQPQASAFQKVMSPPFVLRGSSFETGLSKAGADLNRQPESSCWTAAARHDTIRCWCTPSDVIPRVATGYRELVDKLDGVRYTLSTVFSRLQREIGQYGKFTRTVTRDFYVGLIETTN